ncbi:TPA: thiamine ABC transporter permease [Enterobacter hormaechei subsp. xiangfangensis]
MASPLRNPLSGLVWAAMAVIYLPLLPASGMLLAPAFSPGNWATLFADPQLPQALAATLVSTLIATLGSLFFALTLLALLWPGEGWQRLSTRLPWLLAVPHVAFATSALLLFAEGGQFYRICTVCSPQLDRYGIGLGLTLAVKESAFVLWAIYAALPEKRLAQQKIVLHTFGYGRMQALNWLVLPAIAPALGAVMLAVLAWQWLAQGDAQQQTKGTLLCLVLLLLLAALAAVGYGFWTAWRRAQRDPSGIRHASHTALPARTLGGLLPLCGVLCALVLLMLARRDDIGPVSDSLSLGLLSSLTALAILMLWLEWGPQRGAVWVWLPLALPALPLVSGQYAVALWLGIDGQYAAVLWSHMLWVLPWMLLVLQPAWRRLDPRLILTARTLGWRQAKIFWFVKCPLMIRPALLAFATGFSVSMAQYMPTLWLGAGHFTTLTTEAVALSSGGSIPILASRALGLLLLTSSVFALAALLSRLVGRHRQGLR